MNFLKVNEKPTNALIIQCIGTQHSYSPTCFGNLKCHNQGVKYDPAEIGAQYRGKQRRMGTLGTYLSRIMFDSLITAF
jgi:hypothetical protein